MGVTYMFLLFNFFDSSLSHWKHCHSSSDYTYINLRTSPPNPLCLFYKLLISFLKVYTIFTIWMSRFCELFRVCTSFWCVPCSISLTTLNYFFYFFKFSRSPFFYVICISLFSFLMSSERLVWTESERLVYCSVSIPFFFRALRS